MMFDEFGTNRHNIRDNSCYSWLVLRLNRIAYFETSAMSFA